MTLKVVRSSQPFVLFPSQVPSRRLMRSNARRAGVSEAAGAVVGESDAFAWEMSSEARISSASVRRM
jgi:hypothetical protein